MLTKERCKEDGSHLANVAGHHVADELLGVGVDGSALYMPAVSAAPCQRRWPDCYKVHTSTSQRPHPYSWVISTGVLPSMPDAFRTKGSAQV